MVRASPDFKIWKLRGEYTTAASTLLASRLGTSPPPPTGTRVKSIFLSWMVHSANRSEPEPAAVIATFLPLRSLTSMVDFSGTINCQPKLPIEALATIRDITPFLRPAETSDGGSRMTSAAPAAMASKVSAPLR